MKVLVIDTGIGLCHAVRLGQEGHDVYLYTCFDEKTEILTDKGWKFFKDLDGSERVATLNPETKEIEYHFPDAYQKYYYEGEVLHFYGQKGTIDLVVTPEHKIWGYTVKKGLKPYRADSLPKSHFWIPRTGIWVGKEEEWFILPGHFNKNRAKCPVRIKMDDWLEFLGWYLSKGSIHKNRHDYCSVSGVEISQKKKDKIEKIKKLLERLPFKFSVYVAKNGMHYFQINSVQLAVYLSQFGRRSEERFIPDFVKWLSPRQINIFLDAFLNGDGGIKSNGTRIYYSSSKRLIDDIQELVFKIGKSGSVRKYSNKGFGRGLKYYLVEERKCDKLYMQRNSKVNYIHKEFYAGFVYDVTVQNHIIYVRRNGIPIWSGNCWQDPFPKFRDYIIGDGFPGIIKVQDWAKYLDEVDFVVFTDCGFGELADYLRKNGYLVFGGGKAEEIELNRRRFHEVCDEYGLLYPKAWNVDGVEGVLDFLKTQARKDKRYFIKVNCFRGDIETTGVGSYEEAEVLLKNLEAKLGPYAKDFQFVIEEEVDGVEIGFDSWFNGDFLLPIYFTLENYDNTLGFWDTDTVWTDVLLKIQPYFEKTGYRGPISFEGIYDGDKIHLLDPTCYDEATEILTKDGWKKLKDVEKNELVATLNPNTHELEYQPVKNKFEYDYDGDMVEIKSNGVHSATDLLITPDHNVYCSKKKTKILSPSDYDFIKADKLKGSIRLKRTAKWTGKTVDIFILDGYKRKWKSGRKHNSVKTVVKTDVCIKMNDWLEFLGLYLAEGSISLASQTVFIHQKSRCEQVEQILNKLPFGFVKREVRRGCYSYRIRDQRLVAYLKQFGSANEKFVPSFVKELSPEQIERFLYGFWVGDGSLWHKQTASRQFFTVSQRLADDIQELLLKIGNVGFIKTRHAKGTVCKIKNKEYIRKDDLYTVKERTQKKDGWIDSRLIRRRYYRGKVYCVEVPNHIIYVRRNGIPVWCGNCRFAYPTSSATFCQTIKDYGELLYSVAQGKDYDFDVTSKYAIGINIYTEQNFGRWLLLDVKDDAKFWPRRACIRDDKMYITPGEEGETIAGVVVGEGHSYEETFKDASKQLDKISVYGKSFNWGVYDVFKKAYIEPLKKYGIEF